MDNALPAPLPAALPAHLGWRVLAMVYDAMPNIALWFAVSGVALAVVPGHAPFAPWSLGQFALWLLCWAISGLYAVMSWRGIGQTLGMRPWRLKVLAADGRKAGAGALWLRYAVATVSLAAAGLGFAWSLVDRERRTWHDIASRTVMVRLPKP
ncbi:MAG: RDD family protein [Arenimonas sp.]|uniref:RDD family protein n=1 Tax=Arenimonas sp. TaxID=1872635 RepID=UPI0025BEFBCA|nr:RDD family protein [Arenimonas sp.]MBW8367354.1 RDD family protein [Arenimonas sp.]